MNDFIKNAKKEIGKRLVVSLRIIHSDKEDEYLGYWGVIHSVGDGGFLVLVEGGSDEKYEVIPPDINFLAKAEHEVYEFNDEEIVENVDYEVYLDGADDPSCL